MISSKNEMKSKTIRYNKVSLKSKTPPKQSKLKSNISTLSSKITLNTKTPNKKVVRQFQYNLMSKKNSQIQTEPDEMCSNPALKKTENTTDLQRPITQQYPSLVHGPNLEGDIREQEPELDSPQNAKDYEPYDDMKQYHDILNLNYPSFKAESENQEKSNKNPTPTFAARYQEASQQIVNNYQQMVFIQNYNGNSRSSRQAVVSPQIENQIPQSTDSMENPMKINQNSSWSSGRCKEMRNIQNQINQAYQLLQGNQQKLNIFNQINAKNDQFRQITSKSLQKLQQDKNNQIQTPNTKSKLQVSKSFDFGKNSTGLNMKIITQQNKIKANNYPKIPKLQNIFRHNSNSRGLPQIQKKNKSMVCVMKSYKSNHSKSESERNNPQERGDHQAALSGSETHLSQNRRQCTQIYSRMSGLNVLNSRRKIKMPNKTQNEIILKPQKIIIQKAAQSNATQGNASINSKFSHRKSLRSQRQKSTYSLIIKEARNYVNVDSSRQDMALNDDFYQNIDESYSEVSPVTKSQNDNVYGKIDEPSEDAN